MDERAVALPRRAREARLAGPAGRPMPRGARRPRLLGLETRRGALVVQPDLRGGPLARDGGALPLVRPSGRKGDARLYSTVSLTTSSIDVMPSLIFWRPERRRETMPSSRPFLL